MLTCLPKTFCTWNYRILGASAGSAEVKFDMFTEEGSISLGDSYYEVVKHGPLSGRWTLEREGQLIAEASKPSSLFRRFEVQVQTTRLTVKAQAPFARDYGILQGDTKLGEICPAHPFTRRAVIECAPAVPELAQLFSFWLAVLTWRRAAKSSIDSGA